MAQASSSKKRSTRLSQRPCLGVKVNCEAGPRGCFGKPRLGLPRDLRGYDCRG